MSIHSLATETSVVGTGSSATNPKVIGVFPTAETLSLHCSDETISCPIAITVVPKPPLSTAKTRSASDLSASLSNSAWHNKKQAETEETEWFHSYVFTVGDEMAGDYGLP